MMNDMTVTMNEYDVIGINQCLCLPKAEFGAVWLSGVQLDSNEAFLGSTCFRPARA